MSLSINVDNISFSYNRKNQIFRDVALQINQFPLIVTGENGAGKSTFLKILCGLIKPNSGEIVISPSGKKIGYLPQFPIYLPWLSVKDNLLTLKASDISLDDYKNSIAKLDLDFMNLYRDKNPSNLSGGNLQKLGIFMSLIPIIDKCNIWEDTLLVLDEPMKSLDLKTRRNFLEILDDFIKKGVLIICIDQEGSLVEKMNKNGSSKKIEIKRKNGISEVFNV
jgi:ABC-type multidrug transport system ATPase subunit